MHGDLRDRRRQFILLVHGGCVPYAKPVFCAQTNWFRTVGAHRESAVCFAIVSRIEDAGSDLLTSH